MGVEFTETRWMPIPDWPGFLVSDRGEIRSPHGYLRKPSSSRDGHLYVLHRFGGTLGRQKKLWIHRAVLLAFRGPCPAGMEARHLNGNPADNRVGNLAWGTRWDQRDDDRKNCVSRVSRAKLSVDEVEIIRKLKGLRSARAVAKEYSVSHTSVLEIWRNRRWATVPE
jgi:hypothetical protein